MTALNYGKIDELLKAVRASQRNIAIVCFIALASVWSFDGNDLELVDKELREVRSLASTWDPKATWLVDWARRNTSVGPAEVMLANPLVFAPQDHGADHNDAYKNPGIVANKVEAWSVRPLPASLTDLEERARREHWNVSANELLLAMPQNMSQFVEFWNDLGKISVKSMSFDRWPGRRTVNYRRLYYAEDIDEASDTWFDEALNTRAKTDADDDFTEVVFKLRGMDIQSGRFTDSRCNGESWWCRPNNHLKYNAVLFSSIVVSRGSGRGDPLTIAIPVNAEETTRSARIAFRTFYASKISAVERWSDTDFELAFPALNRYAKNGRETLSLSDLNIVVQSDLARNPDRISVFGATIPIGDIGIWVIAAVLALQTFFCTQLLELRRLLSLNGLDENSITEPWVGLFYGMAGRMVAIIATVLLPAGLCGFMVFQVIGLGISVPMTIIGLISTFVGGYVGHLIWSSNRQTRRA